MFAFEVEYLLGRAFAGDFRNRAESEWPPHPARLFSALAAAYFENGSDQQEREALEWLEMQAPPCIRAGSKGDAVPTVAFVPTNYPGDHVPILRGKQPRIFPAQGPSETTVYFVWPEAHASPEVASALDELAARTAYLGKACSLVRMRASDSPPLHNYAPADRGRYILRVPSTGRLQELESLFSADLRPSTGAQQPYICLDEATAEDEPAFTEFEHMAVFAKSAGPGLPVDATVTLTDAVRKALMSVAGATGPIADLIHGHNGTTHCAVVPLPFVGHEHADGHIMGFAVVLPRQASPVDRRRVLAACSTLVENGVSISGVGNWHLEPVESIPINSTLRTATWTRPSRRWSSVTPILLDRFPKKKGPTVEDILRAACNRIGLPTPVAIVHGPYTSLRGVPPVPAFRLVRRSDEKPRWGVHATIQFPLPVRGPVLLGAGRYFGLGLMRPEEERQNDEH